jgi:hypothetical protein
MIPRQKQTLFDNTARQVGAAYPGAAYRQLRQGRSGLRRRRCQGTGDRLQSADGRRGVGLLAPLSGGRSRLPPDNDRGSATDPIRCEFLKPQFNGSPSHSHLPYGYRFETAMVSRELYSPIVSPESRRTAAEPASVVGRCGDWNVDPSASPHPLPDVGNGSCGPALLELPRHRVLSDQAGLSERGKCR